MVKISLFKMLLLGLLVTSSGNLLAEGTEPVSEKISFFSNASQYKVKVLKIAATSITIISVLITAKKLFNKVQPYKPVLKDVVEHKPYKAAWDAVTIFLKRLIRSN